MFLVLGGAGCRKDWRQVYSDARDKIDRLEDIPATEMVEKGLKATAGTDSALNYQFRVLKAELIRKDDPKQALQLLDTSPPPQLSSDEVAVRRHTIQGLCAKDSQTAQSYFADAERIAATEPEMKPFVVYREAVAESAHDEVEAQKLFAEAAELARQYNKPNVAADALTYIGHLKVQQEVYDEAIDYFSQALPYAQAAHYPISEQTIRGNIGWSDVNLGELDQAAAYLIEAQENASRLEKIYSAAFKYEQRWFENLGTTYLEKGEFSKAEGYYLKALAFAGKLKDDDALKARVRALRNLANIEIKLNHLDKADEYNRQAIDAEKQTSGKELHSAFMLTSAEIVRGRGDLQRAEQLLHGIIDGTDTDSSTRLSAEEELVRLLVSEKRFDDADNAFQQTLKTVQTAREQVKEEDKRMSILDGWPFYGEYIGDLIGQSKKDKALGVAEFSRARTLAEGLNLHGLKETGEAEIHKTQRLLAKQHEIIFAYWMTETKCYLWVVTPSQIELFAIENKAKDIDDLVQAYNNRIQSHADIEHSEIGQDLYKILIQPAARYLTENSKIIIVPHASLYRLNFETLIVPTPTPHYWIENVTLQYANSITLLAESRPRRKPTKELLAIGAPQSADPQFPGLDHAAEEIQSVAHHFSGAPQTLILQGDAATPESYGVNHPEEFRVIHLPTHGTAEPVNPLSSAIILSKGQNGFKLYASEIIQHPLNADLVTISACQGAGKRSYSGEGLVGLEWAFIRAGAHQVVAGLWKIDDRYTPEFMDHFYTEFQRHGDAADALRKAKLTMLKDKGSNAHYPYYWAPLQLYTGLSN